MSNDPERRVALVTGASRGIGAAIAVRLARDGMDILLTYQKSEEAAAAVVARIVELGVQALALRIDAADPKEPATAVDRAIERFGRLDVLVNNAGIYETASLLDSTDDYFERAFATNVRSAFLTARAAARVLPSGGRIINIGSILGERVALPKVGIYSATKFAINGFTRAWARDLGPEGHHGQRRPARPDRHRHEPGRQPVRREPARDDLPAALRQARGGRRGRRVPGLARGPVHHRGHPQRQRRLGRVRAIGPTSELRTGLCSTNPEPEGYEETGVTPIPACSRRVALLPIGSRMFPLDPHLQRRRCADEYRLRPPNRGNRRPEADPFRYGWRYVRVTRADGTEELDQVPLTLEDVLHPEVGDIIVQSDPHDSDRAYLKAVSKARLEDEPTAVVLSDCQVDFNIPGVKPLCPDVAMFSGVRRRIAWSSFNVAREGARPVLVIEVTSPETRGNDVGIKVDYYLRGRVPWYLIADVTIEEEGERRIELILYRRIGTGLSARAGGRSGAGVAGAGGPVAGPDSGCARRVHAAGVLRPGDRRGGRGLHGDQPGAGGVAGAARGGGAGSRTGRAAGPVGSEGPREGRAGPRRGRGHDARPKGFDFRIGDTGVREEAEVSKRWHRRSWNATGSMHHAEVEVKIRDSRPSSSGRDGPSRESRPKLRCVAAPL